MQTLTAANQLASIAADAQDHTPEGSEIVYTAYRGSHLYGLSTKDSDLDGMVIYLAPTQSFLGLEQPSHSGEIKNMLPDGTTLDIVAYEVSHLLRQVLKYSGNVLEPLCAPVGMFQSSDIGDGLRSFARRFLPGSVRFYYNFAYGQYKASLASRLYGGEDGDYGDGITTEGGGFSDTPTREKKSKTKHLYHSLRAISVGIYIAKTGKMSFDLEEATDIADDVIGWGLDVDTMMSIKQGDLSGQLFLDIIAAMPKALGVLGRFADEAVGYQDGPRKANDLLVRWRSRRWI